MLLLSLLLLLRRSMSFLTTLDRKFSKLLSDPLFALRYRPSRRRTLDRVCSCLILGGRGKQTKKKKNRTNSILQKRTKHNASSQALNKTRGNIASRSSFSPPPINFWNRWKRGWGGGRRGNFERTHTCRASFMSQGTAPTSHFNLHPICKPPLPNHQRWYAK